LLDWLIENHEFPAVQPVLSGAEGFDEEGDEIDAEPGKSVTMGNHNPELVAAQKSFQ
jgi:hypothetical protein